MSDKREFVSLSDEDEADEKVKSSETPEVGDDEDDDYDDDGASPLELEVQCGDELPGPANAERVLKLLSGSNIDAFKDLLRLSSEKFQTPDKVKEQVESPGASQAQTEGSARLTASFVGEPAKLLGFDPVTGNAILDLRNGMSRNFTSLQGEVKPLADGLWRSAAGDALEAVKIGAQQYLRSAEGELHRLVKFGARTFALADTSVRSVAVEDPRLSLVSSAESSAEKISAPRHRKVDVVAIEASNSYAQANVLSEKVPDGFRTAGRNHTFDADGSFKPADRAATVVDRSQDARLVEIIAEARKRFSHLPPEQQAKELAKYVHEIMCPAGSGAEQEKAYRDLMRQNAGKAVLLSDFEGKGSCTQEALLLKVLADELGLKCNLVRGNNGTHCWTTFDFGGGKKEIFDPRAGISGVSEGKSEFHKPDAPNSTTEQTKVGDKVEHMGEHWTVSGFDTTTGQLKLSRDLEKKLSDDDVKRLNGGAPPQPGDKVSISEDGATKQWTVEGRNADGSWMLSSTAEALAERTELASSPLELANHPDANMRWLQDNWKRLVTDNKGLTDAQRESLEGARESLAGRNPILREQIEAFRTLVTETERLSKTTGPEVARRINSLTKAAVAIGNYPDTVHVSAKKLVNAQDIVALETVTNKLSEVAPFLDIPTDSSGKLKISDGHTYESHASQAMMKAFKQGNLAGGEWVYVPSAAGSAADHLKFDGMLINLSTGEYLPVDMARHEPGQTNPYQTLAKKVNQEGRLWALTLDCQHIGFGADGKNFDGKLNEAEIVKRAEAYRQGKQTPNQNAPKINKLVELISTFGKVPSFVPVNSELEAEARSRNTGERTVTTQQELVEAQESLKPGKGSKLDPASIKMFREGAVAAEGFATDVVYSRDVVQSALRAAVEARKYGSTAPPVDTSKIRVNTSNLQKPFIEITAGDVSTSRGNAKAPSIIKIEANGTVKVKVHSISEFEIGNVNDIAKDVLPKLRELGIDPKPLDQALRSLKKINHANLEADLKTVVDAKTAETFWAKYKELRVVVEAFTNVDANVPLAQESRRTYAIEQEIKQHAELSNLPEADRIALAQKTARMQTTRPDLSLEDVHAINEVEKALKVTEAEALKLRDFQNGLGREASSWTPAELQTKLKAAEAAMTNYPRRSAADVHRAEELRTKLSLPDAKTAQLALDLSRGLPANVSDADLKRTIEIHQALEKAGKGYGQVVTPADTLAVAKKFPNLTEAEAKEIALQRKAMKITDYTRIAEAAEKSITLKNLKPLLDGAVKVWKESAPGEIPKEPTKDFLDCLEIARQELEGKLDKAKLEAYDRMIADYRAEVKAGTSAATPTADMVHGFITAPSSVGKPGEGLWRPPQGIPPGEQEALRKQLAELGKNPLADKANIAEYIRLMNQAVDKWSTDLLPQARDVEAQTKSVNEARSRLQSMALQEAGNPVTAAELMQNPSKGSPEFQEAHKAFKQMSDARDAASQKLDTECKARLAELQKQMNEYAAKHKLPLIELKMASSIPGADALYGLGRGTVIVNQADLLNKGGGAQLLGKGYHELIHFQQDVLVSRDVLDRMKLGNGLSTNAADRARELAEFKRVYKERTGVELPDAPAEKAAEWHKFVEEVAKNRNGVALDPTEAKKADAFAKAFKEGQPFTERYQQIAEAVTALESARTKMNEGVETRSAEELISRLAADTKEGELLRKQFFGENAEGRLKELVDAWKRAPKDGNGRATMWNEEAARKIVQEHIGDTTGKKGRIGQLNGEARDLHSKFMTLVEKEAHLLAGDVHSAVADRVVDAAYQRPVEVEAKPASEGWRKVGEVNSGRDHVVYKPGAKPSGDPSTRDLAPTFNPEKPEGYVELKFEGRPEGVRFFMDTKTNEVFVYGELSLGDTSLKSMTKTFDVEVMSKAQAEAKVAAPEVVATVPSELAKVTAVPSGSVEYLEVDPLTGRMKRVRVGLAGEIPKVELNERSLETLVRGWERELEKQMDEIKNDPGKKAQYEELARQREALAGVRGELVAGGDRARAVVEHFRQVTERGGDPGTIPENVGGRFRGRVVVGAGVVVGLAILVSAGLGYYNRVVEPEKKRRSTPSLPSLGK